MLRPHWLRDGLGVAIGTKVSRSRVSKGSGHTHLAVNLAVHLTVAVGAPCWSRETRTVSAHQFSPPITLYMWVPCLPIGTREPLSGRTGKGPGDSRMGTSGLTAHSSLSKYLLRLVLWWVRLLASTLNFSAQASGSTYAYHYGGEARGHQCPLAWAALPSVSFPTSCPGVHLLASVCVHPG